MAASAMDVKTAENSTLPAAGAVQRTDRVFSVGSRVERELTRLPGDAQRLDDVIRAVAGDAGIGPVVVAPGLNFGDVRGVVEPPAVEHDHARVVELSDLGKDLDGMAEDRAVGRLIQQAPHRDGRVVAVAADHAEDRLVVTLLHLRRIAEHQAAYDSS